MRHYLNRLPLLVTLCAIAALAWHGPVAQLPHYHEFADGSTFGGIPHAADVLSNLGFGLIGMWGLFMLRSAHARSTSAGWTGYALFFAALVCTAVGSAYYHLAPDDARLVWDRLPIALACAGLLSAVRNEMRGEENRLLVALLACAAVASVAWWRWTNMSAIGDLRPYLLLQGLPLVLIPLWLAIGKASREDKLTFGGAILLYLAAKAAELHDHALLATLGWISGHTLKHLLATAAAALITGRLAIRIIADKNTHKTQSSLAPSMPSS